MKGSLLITKKMEKIKEIGDPKSLKKGIQILKPDRAEPSGERKFNILCINQHSVLCTEVQSYKNFIFVKLKIL